jgi:hypothetical protein
MWSKSLITYFLGKWVKVLLHPYYVELKFLNNTCSAHLVRIFSSTLVQLAVRQRKVEKEKETVRRWWRSSVLGA